MTTYFLDTSLIVKGIAGRKFQQLPMSTEANSLSGKVSLAVCVCLSH
jgi:hypothetical protein